MPNASPTRFRPHWLLPGGHLQTLATTFLSKADIPWITKQHRVVLPDGDQVVLHDDCPPDWHPQRPRLLLIHGLSGSHQTSYMTRLAFRFYQHNVRVLRLDMRGSGESFPLTQHINHAGCSGDILAAAKRLLEITGPGPLWVTGVSLGGSQLLKMLGEIQTQRGADCVVRDCLVRAAAVAPPVDLAGCSKRMQRLRMRPYNRYFIRRLLETLPPRLQAAAKFQALDLTQPPKTMWELDDRVTAPLSGFDSAAAYYRETTLEPFAAQNHIPTLVVAAKDDPIVPVRGFAKVDWPDQTQLEIVPGGGHVAFLGRGANRFWLDQRIEQWFLSNPEPILTKAALPKKALAKVS